MINIGIVVGRITKDIELKKTPNGTSVVQFTLASDRIGKDSDTDFVQFVAYGKQADNMSLYVHKGDLVGAQGRIQTRNYTNKSTGQKVYVTEINVSYWQIMEGKNKGQNAKTSQNEEPAEDFPPAGPSLEISADDLPF